MSIFVKPSDSAVLGGAGPSLMIHDKGAAVTFIIRGIATFLYHNHVPNKNDTMLINDVYLYRSDSIHVRSAYQCAFTRDECTRIAAYIDKKYRIHVVDDDKMISEADETVVYLFRKAIVKGESNMVEPVSEDDSRYFALPTSKKVLLISQMAFDLLEEYITSSDDGFLDEQVSLLNKEKSCCIIL